MNRYKSQKELTVRTKNAFRFTYNLNLNLNLRNLIKDTRESIISASYLDVLLPIGRDGQLHTAIDQRRRDAFYFHITIYKLSVPEN